MGIDAGAGFEQQWIEIKSVAVGVEGDVEIGLEVGKSLDHLGKVRSPKDNGKSSRTHKIPVEIIDGEVGTGENLSL